MSATGRGAPEPVLRVAGLSKSFAGVRVLHDVHLELRAGEIHALLGQNGCGKSTLIKCLAGFHDPDDGSALLLDGRRITMPYTPAQASALGLIFVHQDLGLISTLSVTENFAAPHGYGTRQLAPIRWRTLRREAAAQLAALGHPDLDPDTIVGRLPVASQTIVAIARALSTAGDGARVLVLDEPTAALPDSEAERLFTAVKRVAARGVAVLYVTHKLDELAVFVDRATILRDGRNVETVDIAHTERAALIKLIVGREVEAIGRMTTETVTGDPLLSVRGLGGNRLHDVSFDIRPGEVVGVAGMLGSGRSELARIIFGAQRPTAGTLAISGSAVDFSSPRQAVAAGVALIPENRRKDGGFLGLPVAENLTITSVKRFRRGLGISNRAERLRVAQLIADFDVRPTDPSKRFAVLSGGNQQKVVIAKWLETSPRIVVFDEPVQGVDVGARAEIFALIKQAAARGAAVLLISSEIEQLVALTNRVIVLRRGRVVGDWPSDDLTTHRVNQTMYFDDGQLSGGDSSAGDHTRSDAPSALEESSA